MRLDSGTILTRAHDLGFPVAGVAAVEPMDPAPLRAWLDAGYGAAMSFLARHLPLRADLRQVLPGARSVIVAALPHRSANPDDPVLGAVAAYARCPDYHEVVAARLMQLWESIRAGYPGAEGRIFVDAGPLPERELARRAGCGWVGSHSCLVHPALGSRFVLGEILTTLDLTPTAPIAGDCGACRRCRDACPTGAIVAPGVVDARRCLSYLTIEHRGAIPEELRPALGLRLFGCDACQDACPHNRQVTATGLTADPALAALDPVELLTLTPDAFKHRFAGTPILRAKRDGLLRNACVVLGNLGDPAHLPALHAAMHDPSPLVRELAAWAVGRLRAM